MIDRILSLFWSKTLNPPIANDDEIPGLSGEEWVVDAKLQISRQNLSNLRNPTSMSQAHFKAFC
jgi:hypothetical protein